MTPGRYLHYTVRAFDNENIPPQKEYKAECRSASPAIKFSGGVDMFHAAGSVVFRTEQKMPEIKLDVNHP